MENIAPFGSWESPITPELVAGKSQRLMEPKLTEHGLFWLESRPEEKGRTALLFKNTQGETTELLPQPWSAQSRAHEYGGGAYTIAEDMVYFVNASDQAIYRFNWMLHTQPTRLSQEADEGNHRYADLYYAKKSRLLLATLEHHTEKAEEPLNNLVYFDLQDPDACDQAPKTLHTGHDFYSNASISPCGAWLSYLTWDHPSMPWDSTQLWLTPLKSALNGQSKTSAQPILLNNEAPQSIFQPQWSPNNKLYWVSDKNNWWNIYRISPTTTFNNAGVQANNENTGHEQCIEQITNLDAEFATPQWTFGMSTYGFLNEEKIFACYTQKGIWHSATINCANGVITPIPNSIDTLSDISCCNGKAAFIGASNLTGPTLYSFGQNAEIQPVFENIKAPFRDEWISEAQAITYSTTNNQQAHAFYYPPKNPEYSAEKGSKPPLIAICHGGPTGATTTQLNLKVQFWTTRGFAVVDINYRGSTGYGRSYRQQLHGQWGIAEVDDICAATDYLHQQGLIEDNQRIIKGSSAGGYSVLAALAFKSTFNAGVSLYGIGNLETLATDTHKFEARYLDTLVGPYPEERDTYIARSPLFHAEKITCPLLVFQGLKDKVVPPNQAEKMIETVDSFGLPYAYVTYPDEAHGFRQAETIVHMLQAELYFYQTVLLNIKPDKEPPIDIKNTLTMGTEQ